MGLEDRQYYQEDETIWRAGFGGGGGGIGGKWSAIAIIMVTCFGLFFLDAFTTKMPNGSHWLFNAMALKTDSPWMFWTFLTHGFAHASIDSKLSFFHIGGNMLILFLLGTHVERRMGKVEFTKFYLVAIVFSGLCFFLVRRLTDNPSNAVGASGAVTAVVMLFVFYYPKQKLYLFGLLPMPAWVLGVGLVLMDLSRALDPESQIAWEAHLGGALFAFLYFKFAWNFRWMPAERMAAASRKAKLKIHNPDASSEKLRREADALLAKIAEQGESSLTARERRTLNRYSKQVRKERD